MSCPLLISSQSDYLLEIHIFNDSAAPDQLASSEANWSGSALFAKTGHVVFSKRRVKRLFLLNLWIEVFHTCPDVWYWSFSISSWPTWVTLRSRSWIKKNILSQPTTKQQNGMFTQRRLRSAWASTQSDQSLLWAQWIAPDPSYLHMDSEDSD